MTDNTIKNTVTERSSNYCKYGTYHHLANLSQSLTAVAKQHYFAVRTVEGQPAPQMPGFIAESLQMINHKLARAMNGDELYIDNWKDIAGYAQLVVDILEEREAQIKLGEAKLQAELAKAAAARQAVEDKTEEGN